MPRNASKRRQNGTFSHVFARCLFSGSPSRYVQHQLLLSELFLAEALLREGGAFVAKVFRGFSGGFFSRVAASFRLFRGVLKARDTGSKALGAV